MKNSKTIFNKGGLWCDKRGQDIKGDYISKKRDIYYTQKLQHGCRIMKMGN